MKTKHLFGLVAVVATVGLASSAQAGVSINFSFGLPVPIFRAPRSVAVYTPPCPPVVVYQPVPRCAPVVYVAPRNERHYDYRDQRGYDHRRNGREERSHGYEGRGQERGEPKTLPRIVAWATFRRGVVDRESVNV